MWRSMPRNSLTPPSARRSLRRSPATMMPIVAALQTNAVTAVWQRLHEAEQGESGYLQFLELMLEDEITRRDQGSPARRIAQAHFEEIKTLEEFDFGFNPKIPAHELVGERHRRSFMIIASNRTPQDWYPLFPNPVLAEGVLDRLTNRSHHLLLEGRSYRPLLRPDRPQLLAKEENSQ